MYPLPFPFSLSLIRHDNTMDDVDVDVGEAVKNADKIPKVHDDCMVITHAADELKPLLLLLFTRFAASKRKTNKQTDTFIILFSLSLIITMCAT